MFNSLAKIDKEFHYSKAYSWYSDLPAEDTSSKCLGAIGLVKVGCMPKKFSVLELILWCSKHFDATKRIIRIGDSIVPPINLIPIMFQKIMKLPKFNKELKIPEAYAFITNNGGPKRLLTYFTDSLYGVKTNPYQFDINLLKEPSREFAQLFAQVIDQESTMYFPQCVLFVLCGTFKMDCIFYWDKSFQMGLHTNCQTINKQIIFS